MHTMNQTSMAAKNSKNQGLAKGWVVACLLAALVFLPASSQARSVQAVFKPLAVYLEAHGMPRNRVKRLLSSPRLKFEGKLMAALLAKPEKSLDYAQFLTKSNVRRAKDFVRKNKNMLSQAQSATGVPGSVVVAILSIESGLGSYTGRSNTMSILCSQATLDTKRGRKMLYRYWPVRQRDYFRSAEFDKRLKWRADWARGEVMALIHLAAKYRVSPYDFTGSLAGALGMCQFVPSSVLKHGTDGNEDGRVDLDNAHDAVHSVAVYLQSHGWRPGMSRAQKLEVIRLYNKSWPYANTVLDLAAKI
jgi:membrane-bound lytic murein transglycosylase B